MSVVTNCILTYSRTKSDETDQAILGAVNTWLTTEGVKKGFRLLYEGVDLNPAGLAGGFISVDDPKLPRWWYSHGKIFECFIALAAFNYLDLDGLVNYLKSIDWQGYGLYGAAQLIVREQDDHKFRLIDIAEIYEEEKE